MQEQVAQLLYSIVFPRKIRSTLFNLRKFWKTEKCTAKSCRVYWNVMNDKEFGSFKFLKLKYRKREKTIQPFWGIGSPKKLGPFF